MQQGTCFSDAQRKAGRCEKLRRRISELRQQQVQILAENPSGRSLLAAYLIEVGVAMAEYELRSVVGY